MVSARGKRTRAWLRDLAHCSMSYKVLQHLSWVQHPVFLLLLLICAGQGALEEARWIPWKELGAG